MPTRFTLIRHGQTAWNVTGHWQGHAWIGLNDEGHRQAMLVAEALAETDATVIFASDLPRARQTAEYISKRANIPLILDERLREIHLGLWQGMTHKEVEEWDAARLAQVQSGGYTIRRPGGESQQDVGVRVLSLIDEIQRTRTDDHVLFVAHGGTIRITLMALGLEAAHHGPIDNTSRTQLRFDAAMKRWEVVEYNTLTHLAVPVKTQPGEF
jgi:probable phosphoglycerate mutase